MSKFSELIGSFERTGNFPLEANYIFKNEQELKDFYADPINKAKLHEGLLKVVSNTDNQGKYKLTLYWVIQKNEELEFTPLISANDIEEIKQKLLDLSTKKYVPIQIVQSVKDIIVPDDVENDPVIYYDLETKLFYIYRKGGLQYIQMIDSYVNSSGAPDNTAEDFDIEGYIRWNSLTQTLQVFGHDGKFKSILTTSDLGKIPASNSIPNTVDISSDNYTQIYFDTNSDALYYYDPNDEWVKIASIKTEYTEEEIKQQNTENIEGGQNKLSDLRISSDTGKLFFNGLSASGAIYKKVLDEEDGVCIVETSRNLPPNQFAGRLAYVKNEQMYYYYNGQQWNIFNNGPISIEGGLPDEEDLTLNNNKISIKNRDTSNGKGYIILRTNTPLANQLTQENTIYEVRYNFDLNGKNITLPAQSILHFTGGSFSNGVVTGNNTEISGNARLYCSLAGTFSGTCKVKWFLKKLTSNQDYSYAHNQEVIQALKAAHLFSSDTLDFEKVHIHLKGGIEIDETMNVHIKNFYITFESLKDMDFVFTFSANVMWTGGKNIENGVVKCSNPNVHHKVGFIYYKKWWNTSNWKIDTVTINNFRTGYFIVNNGYLQEGRLDNIEINDGGGVLFYDREHIYSDSSGTAPSSNIITLNGVRMDNTSDKTEVEDVPALFYLNEPGQITFNDCVFQGRGSNEIKPMILKGLEGGIGILNILTFNGFWLEMVNSMFDQVVEINTYCSLIFNKWCSAKIKVNHKNVLITSNITAITGFQEFLDNIEIPDDILGVVINIDSQFKNFVNSELCPNLLRYIRRGIIKDIRNASNPWREGSTAFNLINAVCNENGIFTAIENRNLFNLDTVLGTSYGHTGRIITVDNIPVYEVEYNNNIHSFSQFHLLNSSIEISKNSQNYTYSEELICRIAPLVDITEENVNSVGILGLTTTSSQNLTKFEVGHVANEYTPWKRYVKVYQNSSHNRGLIPRYAKIQIALIRISTNNAYLNKDILIDADENKLIKIGSIPTVLDVSKYNFDDIKDYLQSDKIMYRYNGTLYYYDGEILRNASDGTVENKVTIV